MAICNEMHNHDRRSCKNQQIEELESVDQSSRECDDFYYAIYAKVYVLKSTCIGIHDGIWPWYEIRMLVAYQRVQVPLILLDDTSLHSRRSLRFIRIA